jgi:hypothetical protein
MFASSFFFSFRRLTAALYSLSYTALYLSVVLCGVYQFFVLVRNSLFQIDIFTSTHYKSDKLTFTSTHIKIKLLFYFLSELN